MNGPHGPKRRHLDQVRPRLDWSDCSVLLSKGSGEQRTAAACRMAHKTSRVVPILAPFPSPLLPAHLLVKISRRQSLVRASACVRGGRNGTVTMYVRKLRGPQQTHANKPRAAGLMSISAFHPRSERGRTGEEAFMVAAISAFDHEPPLSSLP